MTTRLNRRRWFRLAVLALMIAALSPLLVFVAAIGVRSGLWSLDFGFDILTLQVSWALTWLGALSALLGLICLIRGRGLARIISLAAVIVAAVTLGSFLINRPAFVAQTVVADVTTDPSQPPGFGSGLGPPASLDRQGSRTCAGLAPVPTQVAPEVAGYAVREAGFTVRGFGVNRADGSRSSVFFNLGYDATVRIRPGQTDVRVAARQVQGSDAEACRLAQAIVTTLQDSR